MTALNSLHFAVIDVEGNGQQPPEIIEIAVVPVDGLTVGDPKVWLVKPDRPISPIVTRKVHGIRDADVANAPRFAEIAPAVLAAIGDRTPVAHNARVEYDVLRRQLPDWSPSIMLDTLRLSKAVWPGLPGYGLDPLLTHAGIAIGQTAGARHRAGFDALATARLFLALTETVPDPDRLTDLARLPGLTPAAPQQNQGGLW
jgi:DNA polymerase III epsilon subunit-like protein